MELSGTINRSITLSGSMIARGLDGRGIVSIAKTGTSGLVDTYTITYTDATTSTFTVTNGANGQITATSFAEEFSSSKAYAAGDYVVYSGQLYQFATAHAAGAWNASHATAVQIADQVSELKSALQSYEDIFTGDVDESVQNWLDEHPEATTTVQDGSLTEAKFTDTLKLKTIKDYVTPEMFGAKGDGVTDDLQALASAFSSGQPVILLPKTYFISAPIVIQNIDNLQIHGNGAALKLPGNSDVAISNIAAIQFRNCNSVVVDDLIVDSGNSWISRPLSNAAGFQAYQEQRSKTHDGFCVAGCSFVMLTNCKALNCCAGFFVSGSNNIAILNSRSVQTMADGVFVTGGSAKVLVRGHYCDKCDDDCYTAISYTQEAVTSEVVFEDSTATDCFGALVCLFGSTKCRAVRCVGSGHHFSPFKLGSWTFNSIHIYGSDQFLFDCSAVLDDAIEPNNGNVLVNGFTGEADKTTDIRLENCEIAKSGSSAYALKVLVSSKLALIAVKTSGFTVDVTGVSDLLLRDCDFDTTAIIPFASSNNIVIENNKFKNNNVSTGVLGSCFYIQDTADVKMINNQYTPYPGAKDFYINGTNNLNVLIDSNSFTKSNGYTAQASFDGVFDNSLGLDVTMFKDGQLVLLNNNLYILINGSPVKLNNA